MKITTIDSFGFLEMVGQFGGTKSTIAGVSSIIVLFIVLRGLDQQLETLDDGFREKLSYESFLKHRKDSINAGNEEVRGLKETITKLEEELNETKNKLNDKIDSKN